MKRTNYYQQIPSKYYVGQRKKIARNRRFIPVLAGLFCAILATSAIPALAAPSTADSAGPAAVSTDTRLTALIEKLRSDDASARQAAAAAITAIGTPARPSILKLVHSPDPGLRAQAVQILLSLPWYVPSDPPKVRELLLGYGSPEVELRRGLVAALANLDNAAGMDALCRLIVEEPSPDVQWTIVSCLRQMGNLDRFRDAQPPGDNSRLLALSGYAKLAVDSPDAADDLRRCAQLEFADPLDDDGEFDFVIRVLCDLACRQSHFDEAVNWRRRELARGSTSDSQGVPIALVELFALQADYGPLKGWTDDLHRAGDDLQKPKLQYAMSRLYRRMGDTARADKAQATAFAASATRAQRYDVSEFLSEHDWDDLAEGELKAYLAIDPKNDGFDSSRADANVHLRLAALAIGRNDDETAAHEKEQAMILLGKDPQLTRPDAAGHRVPVAGSQVWAEIYWRYLRVAVAHRDEKEINRRLEQLLELKPTDSDIAIEIVPLLEQRHRQIDANDLFQWAFDDIKKDLDANPGNAQALNGLAWLCAKCDRKLKDAKAWAEQADAADPDNAAILDTEAEVNFHLGEVDDAVRLETRASSLQPDDAFMKKQLQRFTAARKQPATRPQ